MKNKILFLILFISLQNLFFLTLNANEEFIFDVTEIEILEEGKVIKGLKKGKIKTDDGITIDSDSFLYDKRTNILEAYGNVKIKDINRNIKIFSDEIIYFKNDEKIFSKTNSKAIYDNSKFIYVGLNSLIEQKRNIIKFSKFSNIENLSFPHRSGETFIINDDSIVETIPLPPGQRRIVFTYTKKLDFLTTNLAKNFSNNIQSLTIIIPEDKIKMKVKGLNFTKSQSNIKELKDESYVTYSFDNILVNDNLELTFSKPLENYISTRIMILIIFLILSSIVAFYLYRKNFFKI